MEKFLDKFGSILQKISDWRDEVLYLFIKPYWPRKITPNIISYSRVAIGLLLFVLLFFFGIENKTLIISLFCFGVLTDLFDGSVARGLKKETDFGAMLDPLADRILILPIAVYSLYQTQKWLLLILLLTELAGMIVSMFYRSKAAYKANVFGKARMVLLSLVFFAILEAWPQAPSLFFIDIIWVSLIFSFLSIFTRILELNKKGFIKI